MTAIKLIKGLPKVPAIHPKDDWLVSLLLESNLITSVQAQEAREEAKLANPDISAVDLLLASKMVTSADAAKVKALHFGAEFIDLKKTRLDSDALANISAVRAHAYRVIPIQTSGDILTIAMADPTDLNTLDTFSHLLKMKLDVKVASEDDLQWALDKFYSSGKEEGEDLRSELRLAWT